MNDGELERKAEQMAQLIVDAHHTMVFTGAGISTESGIPDFRGKDGLWTKLDPEDFTIQRFVSSVDVRKMHWRSIAQGGMTKDARPNAAHYAIAELEKLGKVHCVVTQNIDNLHQAAGNSPEIVYELHGNVQFVRCLHCHKRFPMPEIVALLADREIPECPACGGMLKPDAVFFGEALPELVLHEAAKHANQCDLCIVIGSTLVVYPAAYIPLYARDAGAKMVIINIGPTPMDTAAVVRVEGKAGETMSRVMHYVRQKMGSESVDKP